MCEYMSFQSVWNYHLLWSLLMFLYISSLLNSFSSWLHFDLVTNTLSKKLKVTSRLKRSQTLGCEIGMKLQTFQWSRNFTKRKNLQSNLVTHPFFLISCYLFFTFSQLLLIVKIRSVDQPLVLFRNW